MPRIPSVDALSRINSYTFRFEVDGGLTIGRFMEVGGLEVSIETEDVQEGGQNGFVHHLPGRMTWPNITLKRGIINNDDLMTWLYKSSGEQFAANSNQLERRTAAVTLVDPLDTVIRSWNFTGVFPVKWTGPTISAASTEMATEQIEFAHHGFTVDRP